MPQNKKKKFSSSQDSSVLFDGITIDFLDATINLLFSENTAVDRFCLLEIISFFKKIDLESLESSFDKFIRSLIIKKTAKIRINSPCSSPEMIAKKLIEDTPKYASDIEEFLSDGTDEISTDDIKLLISIYKKKNRSSEAVILTEKFIKLYDQYRLGEVDDEEEFCQDRILPLLSKMQNCFTTADSSSGSLSFNMSRDSLMDISTRFINEKRNPTFKIKTGFKAINSMTNGGFEPRRVYLFLGAPGRFKSGNQLNLITSCHRHNKRIQTNDKTKKPCFIYFTYENSAEETFERIFEMSLGEDAQNPKVCNPASWTPEELVDSMRKEGYNDDSAQMFFVYHKPLSQSVTEIRREIETIEGSDYECKGIFVDYVDKVKTIEKVSYSDNEYLRLGVVMAELTGLAKEKNMFIVTSGQLNRNAIQKIEDYASRGKVDIGKDLFSSETSDSKKLLDNADYIFIQNLEKVVDESTKILYSFVTYKRIKVRGKDTLLNPYAVIGFEKNNGIALAEDIYDNKPDFKHSIQDFFPNFNPSIIHPQTLDENTAVLRAKKENKNQSRNDKNLMNSLNKVRASRERNGNNSGKTNPDDIIETFDEKNGNEGDSDSF